MYMMQCDGSPWQSRRRKPCLPARSVQGTWQSGTPSNKGGGGIFKELSKQSVEDGGVVGAVVLDQANDVVAQRADELKLWHVIVALLSAHLPNASVEIVGEVL